MISRPFEDTAKRGMGWDVGARYIASDPGKEEEGTHTRSQSLTRAHRGHREEGEEKRVVTPCTHLYEGTVVNLTL
jgi:hypothetical protein